MHVKIEYSSGHTIELHSVQTIRLAAITDILSESTFEITCFGNSPVYHYRVNNLDILGWHD